MLASLHVLLHLSGWLLESLVIFIALTSFGAMWRGAEEQEKKGWFVTLIWSAVSVFLLNLVDKIDDYFHGFTSLIY